jgi:hypothetical protein
MPYFYQPTISYILIWAIFSNYKRDTVNEKLRLTYKTFWTLLSYLHAECSWSV